MADKTGIQWTDATWNPVTGCSKVSPGCANCYAETMTRRYAKTWKVPDLPWTPANAEQNVILHPERLDQPLRWTKPRMVFVNSMSDLFHEQVPNDYIAAVFGVMATAHRHTFQVLTKRPERMLEWFAWYAAECGNDELLHGNEAMFGVGCAREVVSGGLLDAIHRAWPLPNVWLGVSIENRRFVDRADVLRATPAAVRFISAEPLLGPLLPDADYMVDADGDTYPLHDAHVKAWRPWADEAHLPGLDLTGIDWLIVGGESGPGHRPMKGEWAIELRDVCEQDAWEHDGREGHTAFFFKQWGGPTSKAGGCELDGRTWADMPAVVA